MFNKMKSENDLFWQFIHINIHTCTLVKTILLFIQVWWHSPNKYKIKIQTTIYLLYANNIISIYISTIIIRQKKREKKRILIVTIDIKSECNVSSTSVFEIIVVYISDDMNDTLFDTFLHKHFKERHKFITSVNGVRCLQLSS